MRRRVFVLLVSAVALAITAEFGAQSRPPSVQGPIDITMANGSTVGGASNQLLLFFSEDVTPADQQAVVSAIRSSGAQVVAEIPAVKMFVIAVPTPTTIPTLMLKLQVMTGVTFVGPDLFAAPAQGPACTRIGPIPGRGPTGWMEADNLAKLSPPNGDDVAVLILDRFVAPGTFPPPAGSTPLHGDVVSAFVLDAGGEDASGNSLLQVGRNVIQIPFKKSGYTALSEDLVLIQDSLEKYLKQQPKRKVFI